MRRAMNTLSDGPAYRREAFNKGLVANGFKVRDFDNPAPCDLLLIWNRYGRSDELARKFEAVGAAVVVVENGYLGRKWLGDAWYAMSLDHHNGAGTWNEGSAARWDSLDVELAPWRQGGTEAVVIAQRGIGEPGIGMPNGWAKAISEKTGARIRFHPGVNECLPLADDLASAEYALTWGSGGAIKALVMGIPVQYDFPQWIGAAAATRIGERLFRGDRLPMLRRLAWAQWRLSEIEDGTAFEHLLQRF